MNKFIEEIKQTKAVILVAYYVFTVFEMYKAFMYESYIKMLEYFFLKSRKEL